MAKRLLIDASHQGEVRLVLSEGKQLLDIEQVTHKKSIKGNVYLAKVEKVEPSLQAAFVNYGDEQSGFLPFSEIHPDYYQISAEERQRLLKELSSELEEKSQKKQADKSQSEEESASDTSESSASKEEKGKDSRDGDEVEKSRRILAEKISKAYSIQEVVKKDQIILVQVNKDKRGNKGAALSSYITLPGRFCVLMPNAINQGGVSRKIENDEERSRLKKLLEELEEKSSPNGAASIILRTAAEFKTKAEIRRDHEYLMKLWQNICNHTIKSNAPAFIYEEGDVIKKALRDLYDSEVEEIVVAGREAYQDTLQLMKLIMPSHTDKVRLYKHKTPLFTYFGLDKEINSLYGNRVDLESGGYLIINQTEALVSIDVNSGSSTAERSIENTALKTNLEAARAVARQARLRELSGLMVIDFIDMTTSANKSKVEKELKAAFKSDKSKIQIGRIGQFGLLEMSRQRIRHSFHEANTENCPHCDGRGRIRPAGATISSALRAIENEVGQDKRVSEIIVAATKSLIMKLIRDFKADLAKMENDLGITISVEIVDDIEADRFYLEKKFGARKSKNNSHTPLSKSGDEHLIVLSDTEDDESDSFNHRPTEPSNTSDSLDAEEAKSGAKKSRRRKVKKPNSSKDNESSDKQSAEAQEPSGSQPKDQEGKAKKSAPATEESGSKSTSSNQNDKAPISNRKKVGGNSSKQENPNHAKEQKKENANRKKESDSSNSAEDAPEIGNQTDERGQRSEHRSRRRNRRGDKKIGKPQRDAKAQSNIDVDSLESTEHKPKSRSTEDQDKDNSLLKEIWKKIVD